MQLSITKFFVALTTTVNMYYYGDVESNLKPVDTQQIELHSSNDFIIVGAGSAGTNEYPSGTRHLSIPEFNVALTTAVNKYYYEDVDPNLKPVDTQPNDLHSTYDFIIVGAGSAGCVVANRLSENGNWSVLLLEAGGDETAETDTPYVFANLVQSYFDWNYTTVEQKYACLSTGGSCNYVRGYGLGGSSTVNGMIYARGNKEDYNTWCTKYKNPGWCYHDVLPYFIKSENADGIKADAGYFGRGGPQNVQYSVFSTDARSAFIKAGAEYGFDEVDYNGRTQSGIGVVQNTMKGRSRMSTAKAYLNPIRTRKNLQIGKLSEVTSIKFDDANKRATGVVFVRDNKTYAVGASKEVILSAGTINTPKLLMLSGIGPKNHLMSFNISVIQDLPVGESFTDHVGFPLRFRLNVSSLTVDDKDAYTNEAIDAYAKEGNGPLTYNRIELVAFTNTEYGNKSAPNVELHIVSSACNYDPIINDVNGSSVVGLGSVVLQPVSRGTVRLASNDPKAPPLINPNYFTEKQDRTVVFQGAKIISKLMSTNTMKSYGARVDTSFTPDCSHLDVDSDAFLECLAFNYTSTGNHAVGTAKMGPRNDNSTVVSSELLVHGFDNLRVVDASVMPSIPRSNINAPVIMIAEKVSDLIIAKYHGSK